MNPSHLPGGQKHADERLDKKLTDKRARRDGDESGDQKPGHGPGQVHIHTTETRPETSTGAKVLDSSAQLAGDRLRSRLGDWLRLIRIGRFVRAVLVNSDINVRVGVLHGCKSRDNIPVSVFDLIPAVISSFNQESGCHSSLD